MGAVHFSIILLHVANRFRNCLGLLQRCIYLNAIIQMQYTHNITLIIDVCKTR